MMPAQVLQPNPAAVAELSGLRHREMLTISKRLGRMSRHQWDRVFSAFALVFLGGAIGGAVALIPFLATNPPPSHTTKVEYGAALIAAVALALICAAARLAIKSEREDSCKAIKEDLDYILSAYSSGDTTSEGSPK